mmetsp:Transcript_42108/g.67373  ORF Transcript_42108/g.67373 Transcript_42108/m.67373 type:complete len:172 (-) Transcript_42108:177-692(-)
MNSCTAISALIMLVVTNLATIISFATPYWLEGKVETQGLWAKCVSQECSWVFQEVKENNEKDYIIATQGLMSVGLAVCLIALLVSTLALCCQCNNCNYTGFVAGLLITAFLSIGIATAVYGIKTSKVENAELSFGDNATFRFGWSFWTGVGAAGMAMLTSLIYGCSSRRVD